MRVRLRLGLCLSRLQFVGDLLTLLQFLLEGLQIGAAIFRLRPAVIGGVSRVDRLACSRRGIGSLIGGRVVKVFTLTRIVGVRTLLQWLGGLARFGVAR